MANYVTGPNAAKVYIQRPYTYRRPGYFSISWPNPTGNLFYQDQGAVEGDPQYFRINAARPDRVNAPRKVRRAVDMWNEAAGETIFEMTRDKDEADVLVREAGGPTTQPSHGRPAEYGPEYPDRYDKPYGVAAMAGMNKADPTTIAHELGHTQGLKHLNMNPKPGVMRYGVPGGGTARRQPTSTEGQKVVHKQGKGVEGLGSQKTAASASAAQFNKAAAKQKKPKKPAHERKVTGGHKVMQ